MTHQTKPRSLPDQLPGLPSQKMRRRDLPPMVMLEDARRGIRTPMLNIGNNTLIELPKVIAAEHSLPSPRSQFSAMMNAVLSIYNRAASTEGGVTIAESAAIFQLVTMMTEAQQGNYTDPRWPEESRKAGRRKPWAAKSRAEHSLIHLVRVRQRITGCELPEACHAAVNDLAHVLQVKHSMDLTKEFSSYSVKSSSEARSNQRKRRSTDPPSATGIDALATIARRVEDWITNGRSDDLEYQTKAGDDMPWQSPRDHYSAVLANAVLNFVWATPHESKAASAANLKLQVLKLEPDDQQPIQPE